MGGTAQHQHLPVCSGLPGVLPVLNRHVVEKAVLLATAMHSEVREISHFDRKNYFYPDLPKGFQITQFDQPIGVGGYLDLPMPEGYVRRVGIEKMHMEEDAGKTKNERARRLIDFNRCGVPLVEMVTRPDLRTPEEAAEYLTRLRQLIRWLGISEGDMEKGHLRCDGNISIRVKGSEVLNTKTEIKNVNSIEAVRTALQTELERQIREVEAGNEIKPWTLDWDADKGELRKMRSKETEADYRYSSANRICCRYIWMRPGKPKSWQVFRSFRWPAASVLRRITSSRIMTPKCSPVSAAFRITLKRLFRLTAVILKVSRTG